MRVAETPSGWMLRVPAPIEGLPPVTVTVGNETLVSLSKDDVAQLIIWALELAPRVVRAHHG